MAHIHAGNSTTNGGVVVILAPVGGMMEVRGGPPLLSLLHGRLPCSAGPATVRVQPGSRGLEWERRQAPHFWLSVPGFSHFPANLPGLQGDNLPMLMPAESGSLKFT